MRAFSRGLYMLFSFLTRFKVCRILQFDDSHNSVNNANIFVVSHSSLIISQITLELKPTTQNLNYLTQIFHVARRRQHMRPLKTKMCFRRNARKFINTKRTQSVQ